MWHGCVPYVQYVLMTTLGSLYSHSRETHFTTKHQPKLLQAGAIVLHISKVSFRTSSIFIMQFVLHIL
jgi:hypothetical protein